MPRANTCEEHSEGVDPMGRGRVKAKQTKVARDLKYRSIDTDFASLERELRSAAELEEDVLADEDPDPDEYEVVASPYDEDDIEVDLDDDDRR